MPEMREWMFARFRFVVTGGLTSCVLLSFGSDPVHAGWFSLPKIGKPAAEAESDRGFNGSIRKLMKEAKEQESLGNLDRAITLAERASTISESSSTVLKTAADVSPAATTRYANDLRLKKAEQSVKRQGGVPPLKDSPAEHSPQVTPPLAATKPDTTKKDLPGGDRPQESPRIGSGTSGLTQSSRLSQPRSAVVASGNTTAPDATTASSMSRPGAPKVSTAAPLPESDTPARNQDVAVRKVTVAPSRIRQQPLPPAAVPADVALAELPARANTKTPKTPARLRRDSVPAETGITTAGLHSNPENEGAVAGKKEPPVQPRTDSADSDTGVTTAEFPLTPRRKKSTLPAPSRPELKTAKTVASATEALPKTDIKSRTTPARLSPSIVSSEDDQKKHDVGITEADTATPKPRETETIRAKKSDIITSSRLLRLRPNFVHADSEDEDWLMSATQLDVDSPSESDPKRVSPTESIPVARVSHESTTDEMSEAPSIPSVTDDSETEPDDQMAYSVEPTPDSDSDSGSEMTTFDDEAELENESDLEFPMEKIRDLKRRMDSVVALQPGKISSVVTADMSDMPLWDDEPNEALRRPRTSERLEEDRSLLLDVPPVTRIPQVAPETTRKTSNRSKTSTGRSTVIQWRSARPETTNQAANSLRSGSKNVQMQDDLRQSPRKASEASLKFPAKTEEAPIFGLPTVDLSDAGDASGEPAETPVIRNPAEKLPELRGSLWNHAAAPLDDSFSGSAEGTSTPGHAVMDQSHEAPMPPSSIGVERISFDERGPLYDQYRSERSAKRSNPPTNRSESKSRNVVATVSPGLAPATLASRPPAVAEPTDAVRRDVTGSVLTNGPLERIALLFGIPVSSVTSILGTVGVMLALACIWRLRPSGSPENR